jgi:predicted PurR-regulated permease PerM
MTDINKSYARPALYALIALGLYLTYRVLSPFFVALTWAVIFAILFRRMQVALSARISPARAALLTTLLVGMVVVTPAVVLISAVAREAPQITDYVTQSSRTVPPGLQRIWDAVRARSPFPMPENPAEAVAAGAKRAANFLAPRAGGYVADFFATLGTVGAMLFALFFMLRDGDAMSRQLRDRLPMSAQDGERLISDTRDMVIASVGAGLVVAAAQGIIGGLAFWLAGIRAPLFWGVVMGFASWGQHSCGFRPQ